MAHDLVVLFIHTPHARSVLIVIVVLNNHRHRPLPVADLFTLILTKVAPPAQHQSETNLDHVEPIPRLKIADQRAVFTVPVG
jgi:hypothetical protein